MKILVIGATGQIGSALVDTLSRTDHQITVLVRNRSSFKSNIRIIQRDQFSPFAFDESLVGIDHIIYGVGLPDQFMFDEAVFEKVNCGLLNTFLDSLERSGVKSLTYISTYEVFKEVNGIISESDQFADERDLTSYFKAMLKSYKLVTAFARENKISLTTIHPAAVYGGLNTGRGITDFIENVINKAFWKLPFIVKSQFPVVHVDSLSHAVVLSLELPQGAYIVSDQMTSLRDIALAVNKYVRSYVPMIMPVWVAKMGIQVLEVISRVTGIKPIMSKVQIQFITKGLVPESNKLQRTSSWMPLSLDEGLKKYIDSRPVQ